MIKAIDFIKEKINSGAYLLSGVDAYWQKMAENHFRALLPENSFSLFIIDRLIDVGQILSCINVLNFDNSPNVVIIRDEEAKLSDNDHSLLLNVLSSNLEPNYLVFCNSNFLTANEKKLLNVIDCNKIDKYDCVKYIIELFPHGIDNFAASKLADYTDCNMAKINNECDKLNAYCQSNKITVDDVDMLVAEDNEVQIFSFANNVINKKYVIALKQLENLHKYGVSPAWILSTLIGQFQRIMFCAISPLSDEELSSVLGIKPYAVKKTREIGNYNRTQLRNYLDMAISYEYKFKSGEMSDSMALNCVISNLLSKE